MQQKVLCEAIAAAGTGLHVCNLPLAGRLPSCLRAFGSQLDCRYFSHCRVTPAGELRDPERGCAGCGEMHLSLPSVLGVTVLLKKPNQNLETLSLIHI